MRIVVLDGHTLNPGDLSWAGLEALGDVTVHDRTAPDQVVERSQGFEIVLTNKALIPAAVLAQLLDLKAIAVTATGTNVVDVEATRSRGIPVMNVPGYGTTAVAQFTIGLLLELCHHVGQHANSVHRGDWATSPDWSFHRTPQIELAGRTMGVFGYGNIGRAVGEIGKAMGMRLITHSRTGGPASVSAEEIFAESDVLTFHCPLTPETQGIVNRTSLSKMKSTAFLINTARGGLIVEQDLADALLVGQIAGAALDVLSSEPPSAENPLLSAKNCIVTPHMAWAATSARQRLLDESIANVAAFISGTPRNLV